MPRGRGAVPPCQLGSVVRDGGGGSEAAAAPETSSSEASAGQRAAATAGPQPSPPSNSQHSTRALPQLLQLLLAGGHLRAVPLCRELCCAACAFIRAHYRVEVPAGVPPVPGLIFETRQSRRPELLVVPGIIGRDNPQRPPTAVLSSWGYGAVERRFAMPGRQDLTRLRGLPRRRPRVLCERCNLQRPGEFVFCIVCGRGVGPGCTPGCLLAEFPNAFSRLTCFIRIGLCVDCIPVVRPCQGGW